MQAAVEFLLIAKQPQQAFDIAQTQGQMDPYVRFMGNNASNEDSVQIALYYEARGNKEAAAELYARSGQPQKALSLYMQVCAVAVATGISNLLDALARFLALLPTVQASHVPCVFCLRAQQSACALLCHQFNSPVRL